MGLINVNQINPDQLALAIQRSSSGAAFSGNLTSYLAASGWIGPLVVTITGNQNITGVKRFLDSPLVPYSGSTGSAPSAKWVNDQIATSAATFNATFVQSGNLIATSGVLSNSTALTGAALSKVQVTGSSTIQAVNLTGMGGALIIYSGGFVFVSGAAGGAGSSNTSVTGSAAISAPNFTGVGSVVLTYDGTYVKVSGAAGADATLSGYVENTFVHRTNIDESITGIKTFVSSPLVPSATIGTQAINLAQLSGASGSLIAAQSVTNNYYITGTGIVTASFNASGGINNTFSITSGNTSVANSGATTNTFTNSGQIVVNNNGTTTTNNYNGATTNVTNLSGITGNFVNMSFWFDSLNLSTGLNTIEAFVSRSFYFTGYGLGVINTGTQGYFSGSFYQRNTVNTKTNFIDFSLNNGLYFKSSGGFFQEISGMNRVGLDIYRIGTGITGLSVGLFGVGY